nr:ATP-binding protein [Oceanococcus sp. HetDA_MAG_MS8]
MIERNLRQQIDVALSESPAVAILGPRQVGKTTLARRIAESRDSIYLDLESERDLAKLTDPESYLRNHSEKLVIIDEIQRSPGLFQCLRGLIDESRARGRKSGLYLLLGSASMELLRQSGESLAGRIRYLELPILHAGEVQPEQQDLLWVRGGFPDSLLASSDGASLRWRQDFIRTYLERDIPQLGPRIPAESLRRLWTMLAHQQGGLLNAASLARSLAVDGKTVASYIDLLVDLLLVRRLEPWHANVKKRLVKSPKVYVRDCGLTHALLGIRDQEALLGHPIAGDSWEGHVIESILAASPYDTRAYFYRTAAGAELDLILQVPNEQEPWAVEIKRSSAPSLGKGFHNAREDVKPSRSIVVYGGCETYSIGNGIEAMSLKALCSELMTLTESQLV